jgi:DNA-binding MarR family transcriptional regulator
MPYYCLLVEAASRQSEQLLTVALDEIGLRPNQFAVMDVVDNMEMNQGLISQRTRLNRSVMVAIIDDLEHMKFVVREVNPHNRREYLIKLTDRGRDKLAEANKVANGVQKKLLAPLTKHEQEMVCKMLEKITNEGVE